MSVDFSAEVFRKLNIASFVLSGLAILVALIILLTALYIWCIPHARHAIDRVSFRLLLWSMAVEIIYSATYIAIYARDPRVLSNAHCSAMVYLMFASMGTVNWFCTCIALNLMLTIVFWVNPVQLRLERWYVTGSLVLGIGVPVVPAILGHFGKDKYYGTCFMTQPPEKRRLDLILDVYLWQGLTCIISTIATTSVLVTLFKQGRKTAKLLYLGNALNADTSANRDKISSAKFGLLKDRFLGIAVRISWYPISLVVVNTILTVGDLYYNETGGVKNMPEFLLMIVYSLFFGGRGLIFGLLGIFVDPCLRRGLKAARITVYTAPDGTTLPTGVPATGEVVQMDYEAPASILGLASQESDGSTSELKTPGLGDDHGDGFDSSEKAVRFDGFDMDTHAVGTSSGDERVPGIVRTAPVNDEAERHVVQAQLSQQRGPSPQFGIWGFRRPSLPFLFHEPLESASARSRRRPTLDEEADIETREASPRIGQNTARRRSRSLVANADEVDRLYEDVEARL